MSDEPGKAQRLKIVTASGEENSARVHCPRRHADIDVADCNTCQHCVGLSVRDSYLVCTWEGGAEKVARGPSVARASHSQSAQFMRATPPESSAGGLSPAVYMAFALTRFERQVITAKLDETALAVACRMRDHKVGCIVVVRDERPVGMLTDRDLVLRVVAEGLDPAAVLVSSIVTYDAVTVARTDGFETAVRTMRQHGVRRLPIVDADGRVTGIVTADDLVALLGSELSSLGEAITGNVDGSESR